MICLFFPAHAPLYPPIIQKASLHGQTHAKVNKPAAKQSMLKHAGIQLIALQAAEYVVFSPLQRVDLRR